MFRSSYRWYVFTICVTYRNYIVKIIDLEARLYPRKIIELYSLVVTNFIYYFLYIWTIK